MAKGIRAIAATCIVLGIVSIGCCPCFVFVAEGVRTVTEQVPQLGADMRAGLSAIREEIRTGDEESRRYMRTLYEDVIERLGMLRG